MQWYTELMHIKITGMLTKQNWKLMNSLCIITYLIKPISSISVNSKSKVQMSEERQSWNFTAPSLFL
jgi:hypothetical protein